MSHLKNIAIVGASGRVGGAFARALIESGNFTVTAISRQESTAELPPGAHPAKIDFRDDESIVSALKGQDVIIITLAGSVTFSDLHQRLVNAAVRAGIKWLMPNQYGQDMHHEKLMSETMYGKINYKYRDECNASGIPWTSLGCGMWYEWSLAGGQYMSGIDIPNKKAHFVDDGKTEITMTTWNQCGRAIAALFSLPVTGSSPCLEDYKNQPLYIKSFTVSQRGMLDSVHRVIGDTDAEWIISSKSGEERCEEGNKLLQEGNMKGMALLNCTKVFLPHSGGNIEEARTLANHALGLPEESLDEATKRAVDMALSGWSPFHS